ncbi:hypothetical protein BAUCODRAFT_31093 [Baudoinia panamericana UAMH 10762]|uniref:UFSP1/2/DUB catalytic domain-containing protein n=1 Tax=Baudoinia panamericana (strain UAMH 10762) TaxID=717646 RepID=M2NHJ8_BAUPA|nr:uncharacterized protein BAUCODRAFT_31093 [Baudoinia panamericana UAMH 10762]EMC98829.1 hypothetical protein BAUCODRAFT_31093 [Baudoinia panamericana UAMH 10762]
MKAPVEPARRLGKRELGRYAFEERMPESLATILAAEQDQNACSDVIPVLAQLLERGSHVEHAYLCDPCVTQVYKLRAEGNHFCGYRNIQMLCLATSRLWLTSGLPRDKPTIPCVQSMIEQAWSEAINAHGRDATGGICGTRKHIGTSEAEALLLLHAIECVGTVFRGKTAWAELLDHVEQHFKRAATCSGVKGKIQITDCLPIFLQRPGHSMTIVGFERTRSGERRLLAFDPAWRPPLSTLGRVRNAERCSKWRAYFALLQYEKSERYLRRWKMFETLSIHHGDGHSDEKGTYRKERQPS